MNLPAEYVIQKLYAYGGNTRYVKSSNHYNAGCPVCHEGKSWNKKRRLYYFPKDNFFLCYNCTRSWSPEAWIHAVSGLSYSEIRQEAEEGDFSIDVNTLLKAKAGETLKKQNRETLPYDSINLCDPQQVSFYKNNKFVKLALDYIKERRLDTAINRPEKYFISLKDFMHKNRLIIPFTDPDNQIRFYQSRAMTERDEGIAKYLSKFDSEKTIYGLNNIKSEPNYLFFFEGPIDSFFVVNGLGVTGLKLTEFQHRLLAKYMFFEKIWVLDNQVDNRQVKQQYKALIEAGEKVFMWPEQFKDFKDLNELACHLKKDRIPPEFLINHSMKGHEALLRLN